MKLREIHALILTVLLWLAFLTAVIGNEQIIGSKTIQCAGLMNAHGSALYTVSKDGIYTVLSDSGGEITRHTDAITIINQAITLANTNSGSVLIMDGGYSLSGSISMKSNAWVYVQLGVTFTVTTFSYTSRRGIVDFRGVTNAHLATQSEPANENAYPVVNCLGTSNYECGVLFTSSSTYCSIGKIRFNGAGGYGICIVGADYNICNGTYIYGYAKAGGSNHQGITIRSGSYNKLVDCHADGLHYANANNALYFGGEGPVTYNEVIGGIYENSGYSHAIYWTAEPDGPVDHNTAIGGISRGCRVNGASCGFKLNAATNSYLNWTVIDCNLGLEMGSGSTGAGGCHGNVVYVTVRNCKKGAELWTQFSNNVENNEIHINVDVDAELQGGEWIGDTSKVGYFALSFAGWRTASSPSYVQNNIIYVTARNCQNGVGFAGWDTPMTETQEARYNTLYLNVEVTEHAICWLSDCGGYGRYNTFNGYWKGSAGNCGSVPNADYVYTEVGTAVVATNTFNPE